MANMGGGVAGRSEVTIAREVQQRIGVKTAKIGVGPREAKIRTVGIVVADETKVAHATIKTDGWVEQLFVTYTGQKVKKGQALLALYSPEFMSTQLDYLVARRSAVVSDAGLPAGFDGLAQAARARLELLDVPAFELDELERTQRPRKYVTLRSRVAGTVIEKKAFVGQHVSSDQTLFVIADLSTVWIQAKVYESELPAVALGDEATIVVPSAPEQKLVGKVAFVDPMVEEATRTVRVRIVLSNADELLRPGMFADVELTHATSTVLLVPVNAIIRTGDRDIAYRVEKDDRFVPVEVKIAPRQVGDSFQILSGLAAGDTVVTSANFLLDSESRLRAGGGSMAGMAGMEGMDKPATTQGKPAKPKDPPKSGANDMPGMNMGGAPKSGSNDMPGMNMGGTPMGGASDGGP